MLNGLSFLFLLQSLLQVPNYSPRDVIENLKRRMDGKSFVEMQPWYNGFAGSIEVCVVFRTLMSKYTNLDPCAFFTHVYTE